MQEGNPTHLDDMANDAATGRPHLNELCGVCSWRQHTDERALAVTLCPGPLHVEGHRLHKALTQGFSNVVCCCNEGPILPESLQPCEQCLRDFMLLITLRARPVSSSAPRLSLTQECCTRSCHTAQGAITVAALL